MCICVKRSHLAARQKLTQHCKSTTLQLKKKNCHNLKSHGKSSHSRMPCKEVPCCPSVPGLSAPSLARHRNNRCTAAASSPVPHPAPSTPVINLLVTVAATTLSPLKDPPSEWMHKPSPQPPGSLRKQLTRELKGSQAFQRAPRAGGPPQ